MINIVENIGKFSARCICNRCSDTYLVKCKYSAKKSPVGHLCNTCKTAISSMEEITQKNLCSVFNYDRDTGELTHKHTTLSGMEGDSATFSHSRGYLSTVIGGKQYLAHRIIYMMLTGTWPDHIDHINHNKQDNRWVNLRSVSQSDNNRNVPKSRNNSTGVTGVSLHKPTGRYRAYFSRNSVPTHLGLFDSIEEARLAREEALIAHGYHANHGR